MRLLLTFLILIYSSYSLAHKNTGLEIQDDGTLVGLPQKYEPASFDLKSFVIEVSGKKLSIPNCVRRNVEANDEIDFSVDLSASWYHDLIRFPPYISIRIYPKNSKFDYLLLFNLDNLEFLEAKKLDKPNDIIGFRYSRATVDFTSDCLASIKTTEV
jgi:hypothetical protein